MLDRRAPGRSMDAEPFRAVFASSTKPQHRARSPRQGMKNGFRERVSAASPFVVATKMPWPSGGGEEKSAKISSLGASHSAH
jgi:hypothetical protein